MFWRVGLAVAVAAAQTYFGVLWGRFCFPAILDLMLGEFWPLFLVKGGGGCCWVDFSTKKKCQVGPEFADELLMVFIDG